MIATARALAPARGGVILVPEGTVGRQGPLVTIDRSLAADAWLASFAASLTNAMGTHVAHVAIAEEPPAAATTAVLENARLLLARVENTLLDDAAIVRRLMSRFRRPLLLIRSIEGYK